MKKGLKGFLFRILCGFFLGISVVAPGVSGSVMAVMMGTYRELIEIISNPFKNFKRNFFYVLPMAIGAVISLVISVKLLAFAFDKYPAQSRLLFMGLIIGGLKEVFNQAKSGGFKRRYLIGLAAALVLALAFGIAGRADFGVIVNINLWYLCLAGLVAGLFSLIPGMSVSLVLMLFGVYDYLLNTASGVAAEPVNFILVALPVGACFIAGMVLLSKLIREVFDKYPSAAYFAVLGFMCGSLAAIFPSSLPASFGGLLMCAVMLIIGLAVSVGFNFLGKKLNPDR